MNKRIIVIIDEKKVSIKPKDIDKISSFEEAYKKAIEDAYKQVNRLMKIRERSENEIKERLKEKGFYEEEIEKVMKDILKNRLVDDKRFTKFLIESYIKKGYGKFTIKKKLIEKGVNRNIIDEFLDNIKEDEILKEAENISLKKIKKYKNKKDIEVVNKIKNYLFTRGFETRIIEKVISKLKKSGYIE